MLQEELAVRLQLARDQIHFLGWRETAGTHGAAWATGRVSRERDKATGEEGASGIIKVRVTHEKFDANIEEFLREMFAKGNSIRADRAAISQCLWTRVQAGGWGRWSEDGPLIPAQGLLRADLDCAEWHTAPKGERLPSVNEALGAIGTWIRACWMGQTGVVVATGGGFQVYGIVEDAEALQDRWRESWEHFAIRGHWKLDRQATGDHGGLRLWGYERSGLTICGNIARALNREGGIEVQRGLTTTAPVAWLIPAEGVNRPHNLPELSEEEDYDDGFEVDGDGVGERPGYRMASAISASAFLIAVHGAKRAGSGRLRFPGRSENMAIYPDERGERVHAYGSAAARLGVGDNANRNSFGYLAALCDEDWSLAGRIAHRFDGKFKSDDSFATIAVTFNKSFTAQDLGADADSSVTASTFLLALTGDPCAVVTQMKALLND